MQLGPRCSACHVRQTSEPPAGRRWRRRYFQRRGDDDRTPVCAHDVHQPGNIEKVSRPLFFFWLGATRDRRSCDTQEAWTQEGVRSAVTLTMSRAQGQALLHVIARDACLSCFFLTICFSARRAFCCAPTHWWVRCVLSVGE